MPVSTRARSRRERGFANFSHLVGYNVHTFNVPFYIDQENVQEFVEEITQTLFQMDPNFEDLIGMDADAVEGYWKGKGKSKMGMFVRVEFEVEEEAGRFITRSALFVTLGRNLYDDIWRKLLQYTRGYGNYAESLSARVVTTSFVILIANDPNLFDGALLGEEEEEITHAVTWLYCVCYPPLFYKHMKNLCFVNILVDFLLKSSHATEEVIEELQKRIIGLFGYDFETFPGLEFTKKNMEILSWEFKVSFKIYLDEIGYDGALLLLQEHIYKGARLLSLVISPKKTKEGVQHVGRIRRFLKYSEVGRTGGYPVFVRTDKGKEIRLFHTHLGREISKVGQQKIDMASKKIKSLAHQGHYSTIDLYFDLETIVNEGEHCPYLFALYFSNSLYVLEWLNPLNPYDLAICFEEAVWKIAENFHYLFDDDVLSMNIVTYNGSGFDLFVLLSHADVGSIGNIFMWKGRILRLQLFFTRKKRTILLNFFDIYPFFPGFSMVMASKAVGVPAQFLKKDMDHSIIQQYWFRFTEQRSILKFSKFLPKEFKARIEEYQLYDTICLYHLFTIFRAQLKADFNLELTQLCTIGQLAFTIFERAYRQRFKTELPISSYAVDKFIRSCFVAGRCSLGPNPDPFFVMTEEAYGKFLEQHIEIHKEGRWVTTLSKEEVPYTVQKRQHRVFLLRNDEYIVNVDVVSLYPSACLLGNLYPTKSVEGPFYDYTAEDLIEAAKVNDLPRGLYDLEVCQCSSKVCIWPTKDKKGTLQWFVPPNGASQRVRTSHVLLQEFLERHVFHGSGELLEVYAHYRFPVDTIWTAGMFHDSMGKCIEKKIEEKQKKQAGDPSYNRARELINKLIANSMTGKFAEHPHQEIYKLIRTDEEMVTLSQACIPHTIDLQTFITSTKSGEEYPVVFFRGRTRVIDSRPRPSILLLLIYEYSKLWLLDPIQRIMDMGGFYYGDTDSLFLCSTHAKILEGNEDLKIGAELGNWSYEYEEKFNYAYFCSKKLYHVGFWQAGEEKGTGSKMGTRGVRSSDIVIPLGDLQMVEEWIKDDENEKLNDYYYSSRALKFNSADAFDMLMLFKFINILTYMFNKEKPLYANNVRFSVRNTWVIKTLRIE